MISSRIVSVGSCSFPDFRNAQLYMYEFNLENPVIPESFNDFKEMIFNMIKSSPIRKGVAFLTIDSKRVEKNSTHRRGGPHVDGNFLYGWGGSAGWLAGQDGRILSKDKHMKQYASKKGGTLISSNFSACRAWKGDYHDIPKQGGDCSHFNLNESNSFVLNPNEIYLMNSTCIHESLPLIETVNRTLVRITLPDSKEVL